jgi:hypothetical protein
MSVVNHVPVHQQINRPLKPDVCSSHLDVVSRSRRIGKSGVS